MEVHSPIFGTQEVFAISQKHIFDTWLQHNGAHGPLLASSIPAPTAICPWKSNEIHVYLNGKPKLTCQP